MGSRKSLRGAARRLGLATAAAMTAAAMAGEMAGQLVGGTDAFAQEAGGGGGACDAPKADCGGQLSPDCLSVLGAGALSITEARKCQAQMDAYRSCLTEIAAACPRSPQQQQSTPESDQLEALAKAGGLIDAPSTVVEYYNNAFVYARRGDGLNSRKMLEKAIAGGATQIDVFQRYVQLLKAQEGLLGAREAMADLVRRMPENKAAALAQAAVLPPPKRKPALEALLTAGAPFAPAWFELAALSSRDRVGDQSLSDQRAEKAALTSFQEADEAGKIYRWFLDKDAVEVWRESARRRLVLYENRNLEVAPVSLSAQASNDGWTVVFQILETTRRIRYSVDGGPVKETGLTASINPQTGEAMPRSFISLPLGTERAEISVWYDNVRGEEEGPFPLVFDAAAAFTASAKQVLGALTQKWIQDRAWDNGSQLVYFTHLVSYRCGLAKIEYGVEAEAPDQEFPLQPCDPKNPYAVGDAQEIYLTFEKPVSFVSVRLTYRDGSLSEARRFDF